MRMEIIVQQFSIEMTKDEEMEGTGISWSFIGDAMGAEQ